jgi:hypothetical protein
MDDEIDEGFWLRYMLGTWLRQVVDELAQFQAAPKESHVLAVKRIFIYLKGT